MTKYTVLDMLHQIVLDAVMKLTSKPSTRVQSYIDQDREAVYDRLM
jgi:hypothetical protein